MYVFIAWRFLKYKISFKPQVYKTPPWKLTLNTVLQQQRNTTCRQPRWVKMIYTHYGKTVLRLSFPGLGQSLLCACVCLCVSALFRCHYYCFYLPPLITWRTENIPTCQCCLSIQIYWCPFITALQLCAGSIR